MSATNTDPSVSVQLEILGGDHEVLGVVLLRRVEREAIEVLDRGEPFLVGDAPRARRRSPVRLTSSRQVAMRRARPVFGEHVDAPGDSRCPGACPERLAIALVDD